MNWVITIVSTTPFLLPTADWLVGQVINDFRSVPAQES
jgi:hypothetical protein